MDRYEKPRMEVIELGCDVIITSCRNVACPDELPGFDYEDDPSDD